MVNLLHDFDLSFHALPSVWLLQLELLVDLDCNLLIQRLVEPDSDDSVGTLADAFADDVVVDVVDRAFFRAELVLVSVQVNSWVVGILVLVDVVGQMSIVVVELLYVAWLIKSSVACSPRSSGWSDQPPGLSIL